MKVGPLGAMRAQVAFTRLQTVLALARGEARFRVHPKVFGEFAWSDE
jgi:hypothetical protein